MQPFPQPFPFRETSGWRSEERLRAAAVAVPLAVINRHGDDGKKVKDAHCNAAKRVKGPKSGNGLIEEFGFVAVFPWAYLFQRRKRS